MGALFHAAIDVLTTAGGVALILYGGALLRRALDRLFGPRLEGWVRALAARPGQGVLTGLGVSLIAPSSTTMAVLAVQMVQAGQATTRQMLAVMLGAGVGLTATIQLVALNLTHYAPVIVLCGFALTREWLSPRTRQIGKLILGLGFIFLGITIAKNELAESQSPLVASLEAVLRLNSTRFLSALALAVLTQSTTATIAAILAFVAADRIGLPGAIVWVTGANLAVGLTLLIGGWKRVASRRLGVAFLTAQCLAAALVLSNTEYAATLLLRIPEPSSHAVANAHTGFNLLAAVIGLVLLGPLERFARLLVPRDEAAPTERYAPRHIGAAPPNSYAVSLTQARSEVHRLGTLVAEDLESAWRGVATLDGTASDAIRAERPAAERLFAQLTAYLGRLPENDGEDAEGPSPALRLGRLLADLEVVHHVAARDLARIGRRLQQGPVRLSAEGLRELEDYAKRLLSLLRVVVECLSPEGFAAPATSVPAPAAFEEEAEALRDRHLERVRRGVPASVESDLLHLDILALLRLVAQQIARLRTSLQKPPA